jgi:hypothetical protein
MPYNPAQARRPPAGSMRVGIDTEFDVAAFAVTIGGVEVLIAVGFESAAQGEKFLPPKTHLLSEHP